MKILFETHTINLRGVTNSVVDYATYNQTILGNESAIAYCPTYEFPGSDSTNLDVGTNKELVKYLSTKFKIYEFNTEDEFEKLASKFDLVYSQRAGVEEPPLPKSTKTAIHAVFQTYEPHGHRYAYISEWLANHMNRWRGGKPQWVGGTIPFVPLTVELPQPEDNLRESLGIGKNKFVFGRYGGTYTFDLPFAIESVNRITKKHPNIIFLFANTHPSWNHPNVIYTKPFFGAKAKTSFINACDAMLHARVRGESFGLSMCEFLFHDKPVLAWQGGEDGHHVDLLKNYDLLYNESNIDDMILELPFRPKYNYSEIVKPFNAENSMKKFHDVFLT